MQTKIQLPEYKGYLGVSGFTAIELIAVLVILGVFSAVAVSRLSGLSVSIYGDADRLASDLRYAQTLSMIHAQALEGANTVTVNISQNGWSFPLNTRWRFADGEPGRTLRWADRIAGADVSFEYPYGTIQSDYDVDLVIERRNKTITVRVYADTGYVEILR